MNYTPEMEKAMQSSHKMGFAEYGRKLENQIMVEKRRQQDYQKSKNLTAQLVGQLHK